MVQIHTEKNQKEIKRHGNYEFPVNISPESIQSYEQGYFLWHWHPEIELTWIISGQMEYYVNDQKYLLSEGEGLFGNSNTLHSGYMKEGRTATICPSPFIPASSTDMRTACFKPSMWTSLLPMNYGIP